ncbi:nitroreductase [Streptomyces sp. SID5785]|uniref:nitroreductase family protein n=1 Tax=Streptomyces sp. SID5785 TaxID=2690309 RepID=UPI001361B82F|nr:nitroreductase [Streptomyces sp. SID5785]
MSTTSVPRSLVSTLVEAAVTAPSLHNAQPWRFVHRAASGTVELHGEPAPREPDRRALHLACGAALFGLRAAAAQEGVRAGVELLPDPADAWHLADVRLDGSGDPAPQADPADGAGAAYDGLAELAPALHERHAGRTPFTDERVPPELLDGLGASALIEGGRLVLPGGLPEESVRELVRASGAFEATDGAAGQSFEEHPQLALLGTSGDTPADRLRAGQAMQRVLLQATLDGLSSSVLSPPEAWPGTWPDGADGAAGDARAATGPPTGRVQVLVRFGYGPRSPVAPRRPVTEVLSFAD